MSSTSELSRFAARLRGLIASTRAPDAAAAESLPFGKLALELFALQFKHNLPYRRFCEARDARPATLAHWKNIPAIPTSAFKEWELSCLPAAERTNVFHSSGTTAQRPSRHFHGEESLALYEASLLAWFRAHLPFAIGHWRLATLTPSPVQAPHSSLVHMFETIRREGHPADAPFVGTVAADGSWTLELEAAVQRLREAEVSAQPLLLLGTAFSFMHLLDHLGEQGMQFQLPPGSRALETGGYKGRSRILPKAALHALISERLAIAPSHIISEYGMSELSSQAYDTVADSVGAPTSSRLSVSAGRNGIPGREAAQSRLEVGAPAAVSEGTSAGELFHFPPWAKVQIVSPETGREVGEGESGLIRIFDLANVYSVMAIQTEDLGTRRSDGFTLAGRAALAEPRGCSLMASQANEN